MRRVNFSSATSSDRSALWQDDARAAPGVRCYCPPDTVEIFCDPARTTAGSLLAVRLSEGEPPRYMRPGQILRFDQPVSMFYVQNALAYLVDDPNLLNLPAASARLFYGYVELWAANVHGSFVPVPSSQERAPVQLAAGSRAVSIADLLAAHATPAGADVIGAGLHAVHLSVYPVDAGGLMAAVPAGFACSVRLWGLVGMSYNAGALGTLAYRNEPAGSPFDRNAAATGVVWAPIGEGDIAVTNVNRHFSRDLPGTSPLALAYTVAGVAGAGVTGAQVIVAGV